MKAENTVGKPQPEGTKPAYRVDPEVAGALQQLMSNPPPASPPAAEAWKEKRNNSANFYAAVIRQFSAESDISGQTFSLPTADGNEIKLRWYRKTGSDTKSAVIYIHGGGRIAGDLDAFDPLMAYYVHQTDVPFLFTEYRLAPTVSAATQIEDAYASLLWLIAHAAELQIDPNRIAVMGDSGGGGIAAGVAIKARDNGIGLAAQILIYPMLDDRVVVPDNWIDSYALLSSQEIHDIWKIVLEADSGTADIPTTVAPGRLTDFTGLAPAFIAVGFFDIFRKESLRYAQHLLEAGVQVEFHLYAGVPHGFDLVAPGSVAGERAFSDYIRVIKGI